MLARDAIDYLISELGLSALGTSPDGETEYHLVNPFRLVLIEIDAGTLAFFAPLDLPADLPRPRLLRRLLEANLQGVETGQGMMCLHHSDEIGYRDVLDLRQMTIEQLQLRFVDFSLYFDFWRSEGVRILQDELGPGDPSAEGFLRL
ncbi:MAG: type III secretion system chaperone [Paracoccaceae bacterium]